MDVPYDEAKFTELVLHVADRLRHDRAGGATKLNKVLYFADFAHMRKHGRPITGAVYQKLEHGPAPRRLKPVREQLVADGAAEVIHEDFLGYDVHRLVPRRPADLSLFDADELATIDATVADLEHLVGAQVSELSHDEPWWSLYAEGETVPYHAALLPRRQVVTPTARRAAEEVARRYGIVVEP